MWIFKAYNLSFTSLPSDTKTSQCCLWANQAGWNQSSPPWLPAGSASASASAISSSMSAGALRLRRLVACNQAARLGMNSVAMRYRHFRRPLQDLTHNENEMQAQKDVCPMQACSVPFHITAPHCITRQAHLPLLLCLLHHLRGLEAERHLACLSINRQHL